MFVLLVCPFLVHWAAFVDGLVVVAVTVGAVDGDILSLISPFDALG